MLDFMEFTLTLATADGWTGWHWQGGGGGLIEEEEEKGNL